MVRSADAREGNANSHFVVYITEATARFLEEVDADCDELLATTIQRIGRCRCKLPDRGEPLFLDDVCGQWCAEFGPYKLASITLCPGLASQVMLRSGIMHLVGFGRMGSTT